MLSDLNRDFRYALRALLRAPTFTATIITTLSLGIGANSVIFSAVDAVLLRDAPVSDPASLVNVMPTIRANARSARGCILAPSTRHPDAADRFREDGIASLCRRHLARAEHRSSNGTSRRDSGFSTAHRVEAGLFVRVRRLSRFARRRWKQVRPTYRITAARPNDLPFLRAIELAAGKVLTNG
jgi:hypothetical protein